MEDTDKFLYRSLVGKLAFAANAARPGLSFIVPKLAQHTRCPDAVHLQWTIRVLQYVKNTQRLGIFPERLEA